MRSASTRVAVATLITAVGAIWAGFAGAIPVAAAPQVGGVTLDGYGGLHPFGGFSLNESGAPYWSNNYDIARSIVVRPDSAGGWLLDGWGSIHSFGNVRGIASPGSWPGWDIARAIVVTSRDGGGMPDGRQGYLMDGYGGIHPWGGAPSLAGSPYTPDKDRWRGLEIHYSAGGSPDGGWMMDERGRVTAFGAATPLPLTLPAAAAFQKLHGTASAGYVVGKHGVVTTYGSGVSPYWNGYSDWGAWDILRDIVLINPTNPSPSVQPVSAAANSAYQQWLNPRGGVVLDGYGGLHPFGGMPLDARGAPYWNNYDIARATVVRPDGTGGWILDGWGNIHAFGEAPPIHSPAAWSGWDIARAMVVTSKDSDGMPDGRQGYVLDGWGGLHAWGGAPALSGVPYAESRDTARGLEIHLSAGGVPDGGWMMDERGTVTAFGAAPPLAISGQPNAPVLQQLHLVGSGGYTVGKWGVVTTFGSGVSPFWAGYQDWGDWDILRDIALVNPNSSGSEAQPMSGTASNRLSAATSMHFTINDPLIAQSRNLDCEAAALRMALLAKSSNVSEDWILAQMGADLRRAVVDPYGDILQWGDPYQTFVGNVNGLEYNATGYGVYDPPIAMAAGRASHASINGSDWLPQDVYAEVAAGNPVVVWVPVWGYWSSATMRTWTAWDGRPITYSLVEHAMTMIGVDASAGTVTLNDPNRGFVRTASMAAFEQAFSKFHNMAVVVH